MLPLGKKPSSVVETGFDPFNPAPTVMDDGDISIANSFGEGETFPDGPVYKYKGCKIPTLVQWSVYGRITGEILKNVLIKMDTCGAIDQTNDDVKKLSS